MTNTAVPRIKSLAASLRWLYFARVIFAIVWAVIFISTATHLSPGLTVLVILYPAVDAASVIWQLRSEGAHASSRIAEWINVVLSVLAAVGLGVASTVSLSATLATWGAWAALSGITQLIAALLRRRTGGQIPLVISGVISVVAGVGFFTQGVAGASTIANIGGYTIAGAVFFLIAAIRLIFVLRKLA